jgi:hypothetical protein
MEGLSHCYRILNTLIGTAEIRIKTFEFVISLVVSAEFPARQRIFNAIITDDSHPLDPIALHGSRSE